MINYINKKIINRNTLPLCPDNVHNFFNLFESQICTSPNEVPIES